MGCQTRVQQIKSWQAANGKPQQLQFWVRVWPAYARQSSSRKPGSPISQSTKKLPKSGAHGATTPIPVAPAMCRCTCISFHSTCGLTGSRNLSARRISRPIWKVWSTSMIFAIISASIRKLKKPLLTSRQVPGRLLPAPARNSRRRCWQRGPDS